MNYYLLPKNIIDIKIRLNYNNIIEPYVSNSLNFFLNKKQEQLNRQEINENELTNIKNVVNYLNCVFSNNNFVSKLNILNQRYYELIEVISICGIKDILINKSTLVSAHISPNYNITNSLFSSYRNNSSTDITYSCGFYYNLINNLFFNIDNINKLDLLYFEFKETDYKDVRILSKNIIIMLYLICKTLNNGGSILFRMESCIYKIVVEFIYLCSSFFDKTIMIKPVISNVTDNTRFFVCKGFNQEQNIINKLLINLEDVVYTYINNINNSSNIITGVYIDSIIENKIPYYFINKIEELNVVLGQQQIDSLEQAICLIKNKNRDEKIEILRKSNIPKAIQWCEKFNIPHSKLNDKPNIFLKRNDFENINISNDNVNNLNI